MSTADTLRALIAAGSLALLAACSGSSEKPPEPTELQKISASGIRGEVVWRRNTGGFEAEPGGFRVVVDETVVFTASEEGEVSAFSADKGKRLWKRDLDQSLSAGPGLAAELILVGTHDGQVLALDRRDGSERWNTQLSGEVLAPPRGDSNVVIVRCFDGRIYGLDAGSGRRLWVHPSSVPTLSLRGTGGPVIVAGRALIGLDNGKVLALDVSTGEPAWESVVSVPIGRSELERLVDVDAEPAELDGTVYAVSYAGDLAAMDFGRGRNIWRAEVGSIAGLAVADDLLYVSSRSGELVAVERKTGTIIWRQKALLYRELSRPVIHNGHIAVADLDGYVHWISSTDGRLLARLRPVSDPVIAPPVVNDGRLFVLTTEGKLAAVELRSR